MWFRSMDIVSHSEGVLSLTVLIVPQRSWVDAAFRPYN